MCRVADDSYRVRLRANAPICRALPNRRVPRVTALLVAARVGHNAELAVAGKRACGRIGDDGGWPGFAPVAVITIAEGRAPADQPYAAR